LGFTPSSLFLELTGAPITRATVHEAEDGGIIHLRTSGDVYGPYVPSYHDAGQEKQIRKNYLLCILT
jgi:hypothetical protein